jgi:hypothetical protein
MHNLNHFEAMPGRPNATFSEADWLGFYLVFVISVLYCLIYLNRHPELDGSQAKDLPKITSDLMNYRKNSDNKKQILRPANAVLRMTDVTYYFMLFASYLLIILTVSRSAWLGTLAATGIFLWIIFTNLKFNPKNWHWQETFNLKLKIALSLIASIAIVYIFNLTSFQLFNRIQSTGTGLQKITIVCPPYDWICEIPDVIEDVKELEKCECRQINLEDKEKIGGIVSEVYRKDPNIKIRNEIYRKSWEELKPNSFFGIGWGNISKILGTDERGTPLNSSNIFLEVWLGAGFFGFLAFVTLLGYILYSAVKNFSRSTGETQRMFHLFLITSWFGLVVFNLFNAGIFLGFFWVWLGTSQIEE